MGNGEPRVEPSVEVTQKRKLETREVNDGGRARAEASRELRKLSPRLFLPHGALEARLAPSRELTHRPTDAPGRSRNDEPTVDGSHDPLRSTNRPAELEHVAVGRARAGRLAIERKHFEVAESGGQGRGKRSAPGGLPPQR